MIAPDRLPFAPRPIPGEVLSSWLMRIAASNLVQPEDLLEALETHHGPVPASDLLDYSIPEKTVAALSKFCRISPRVVRDMDIRRLAPQLDAVLFMRFEHEPLFRGSRLRARRVRYSFCPLCLVKERDPSPEILRKSTAPQFRAFIEDMHQVLRPSLNQLANCRKVIPISFSRHDILHIIALLIRNAAPSSDLRVRRKHEAKSVALWIALFQVIPARFGGVTLEDLSSRWPNALRRRFASALLHQTRKRWPYSPWGPSHDSGIRFKYMDLARVYDLSAVIESHNRKFQI